MPLLPSFAFDPVLAVVVGTAIAVTAHHHRVRHPRDGAVSCVSLRRNDAHVAQRPRADAQPYDDPTANRAALALERVDTRPGALEGLCSDGTRRTPVPGLDATLVERYP